MKKRLSLLLALCCALMLVASPAFAVKSNEILSHHIMEADGTTGQDTNNGSGVKTGHIQDGAVTDAKISGVISGTKLGSHGHTGAELTDGTVTGSKLADGAVTDAKISGVISAGKINPEGLDADMVDGMHASDLAPAIHGHWMTDVSGLEAALSAKAETDHSHSELAPTNHVHDAADIITGSLGVDKVASYAGIKIVHKGPADNQNTFNDITLAWQSITDNSELNPYAILVMPGVYEVDGFYFNKPYVDLVGSGRNVTTIKAQNFYGSALQLTGHTSLRHLAVEGQSEGVTIQGDDIEVSDCTITANSHVVRVGSGDNIRIRESDIIGVENPLLRTGIYVRYRGVTEYPRQILVENVNLRGRYSYGILGFDMTDMQDVLTLRNVVIDQEASWGFLLESGNAALDNVVGGSVLMQSRNGVRSKLTITKSDLGLVTVYGDSTLDNSTVKGATLQIEPMSSSPTMRIGNSKISGGINAIDPYNLGGIKLVNSYDGNYDSLPNGDFLR